MQRAVDLLGELGRDALHRRDVLHAGRRHAAHAAEALQQAGPLLRPHARDLLELAAAHAHAGPARAVAGLGLNVRMPRDAARGIDQPWIDLATVAPTAAASRNALAATVLSWLLPALEQFDREGLAPFRERYAGFDALRDREVAVLGAGDALHGVALGLADDGGLRIRLSNGGTRTVHAGEVSVRAS